ncbi:uncharacterized protein LOC134539008 [Bacillus rossius redtenbacheri]|uniref:uncharacterized protein LOC134539008 n=1 Tax=Bacillus rossius redtenbacheri TaxID=93214 RepID=UPI002FDDA0CC
MAGEYGGVMQVVSGVAQGDGYGRLERFLYAQHIAYLPGARDHQTARPGSATSTPHVFFYKAVVMWLVLAAAAAACCGGGVSGAAPCGGVLREPRGVLHTPGFPEDFPTPLRCRWILDSSGWPNSTLLVYLTQVFVTSGLTFAEYLHYEASLPQYQLGRRELLPEPGRAWLRSTRPYLVVEFALRSPEGARLRALGGLEAARGFNITYEAGTGALDPERSGACSAAQCSFSGHCYASADYSQFRCACFEGFSGEDCGLGPLCRSGQHSCRSEDDCRQLGSKVVRCRHQCLYDQPCEDSKTEMNTECGTEDCINECPYQQGDQPCKCDNATRVLTDRARYHATIRLANLTSVKHLLRHSSTTLQSALEKQIGRYLRSSLTNVTDLKLLEITSTAEVRFHFAAARLEGGRVRDLLNRLVERGRLGDFALLHTHIALRQQPTLFLAEVTSDPADGLVLVGQAFRLSCAALGSPSATFSWFKDGLPVDVTAATRDMSVRTLAADQSERRVSVLEVRAAHPLDDGVYTCQAVDWGSQQCRAARLRVLQPPRLRVFPRSIAARKGQNISIVCMAENDGVYEKYGYSWAKGKSLLRMSPGQEEWEDLYPMGSILNVYNIQRSAVYECSARGRLAGRGTGSSVEVLDGPAVPTCPAEQGLLGADWPDSAPHASSLVDCPPPYSGTASRACRLVAAGCAAWGEPDLSGCSDPQLARVARDFERLTLGYGGTTAAATLQRCLLHLQRSGPLLPGMGEPAVRLLGSAQRYLLDMPRPGGRPPEAREAFARAVDLLLGDGRSLRSDESLAQLQEAVQVHGATWASELPDAPPRWPDLESIVLDVARFDGAGPLHHRLPQASRRYPEWMTDELEVYIGPSNQGVKNGTITVTMAVYRNLSQFLPPRNTLRLGNAQELHYEIHSHVAVVDLRRDGRRIEAGDASFSASLRLERFPRPRDAAGWEPRCAAAELVGASRPWDLDACRSDPGAVRCRCSRPGAYAVLLTSRAAQDAGGAAGADRDREPHRVVLLGCACCLLQTVGTLLLLLPYWWRHRSCIVYLKLQCCTATSGAMGVFIYAVRDSIPKGNFPYVTSSLEVLLLIGMSSHLSKVLVVYTEVVQLSRVRCLKQTVSSIITVLPVLAVVSGHLAHGAAGRPLASWWLLIGTVVFNMFVTAAAVMALLFALLFCVAAQRLRLVSRKAAYENKSVACRLGFLNRAATILSSMVFMITSSICYINFHAKTYHYLFSLSSAMLGFIIFVCYIWKSETPVCIQLIKRIKFKETSQIKYTSKTSYSLFKLFAKQDGDVEVEGAPPWSSHTQAEDAELAQGLLMTESGHTRAPLPDLAPSTVETYVDSVNGSFIARDLTNSPRKEFGSQTDDPDLQDVVAKSGSFQYLGTVEVSPKQCPAGDKTVVTKVCVELGVITSHGCGVPPAAMSQPIPAIILCSVDVEPCSPDANAPPPETNFAQPATPQPREIPHRITTGDETDLGVHTPPSSVNNLVQETNSGGESTPQAESEDIDCMLNRISDDLDYLLNRNTAAVSDNRLPQTKGEQSAQGDGIGNSFHAR